MASCNNGSHEDMPASWSIDEPRPRIPNDYAPPRTDSDDYAQLGVPSTSITRKTSGSGGPPVIRCDHCQKYRRKGWSHRYYDCGQARIERFPYEKCIRVRAAEEMRKAFAQSCSTNNNDSRIRDFGLGVERETYPTPRRVEKRIHKDAFGICNRESRRQSVPYPAQVPPYHGTPYDLRLPALGMPPSFAEHPLPPKLPHLSALDDFSGTQDVVPLPNHRMSIDGLHPMRVSQLLVHLSILLKLGHYPQGSYQFRRVEMAATI